MLISTVFCSVVGLSNKATILVVKVPADALKNVFRTIGVQNWFDKVPGVIPSVVPGLTPKPGPQLI